MCFVVNINYNNVKLSSTETLLVRSVTGLLYDNMPKFQTYDGECITFEININLISVDLAPTDEKLLQISISDQVKNVGKMTDRELLTHFESLQHLLHPQILYQFKTDTLHINLHRREFKIASLANEIFQITNFK